MDTTIEKSLVGLAAVRMEDMSRMTARISLYECRVSAVPVALNQNSTDANRNTEEVKELSASAGFADAFSFRCFSESGACTKP